MARKDTGVTLVETVVTVSILSILLATGLPALSTLIEHQRVASTASLLVSQMSHARLAAVKHGRATILCPSSDGAVCDTGGDWSNGWIVFVDRGDRRGPSAPGDLLQAERSHTSRHLAVRSNGGRSQLRYLPDGRSAGSNLTVEICGKAGLRLAAVIVNNAGRPRTERGPAGKPCSG